MIKSATRALDHGKCYSHSVLNTQCAGTLAAEETLNTTSMNVVNGIARDTGMRVAQQKEHALPIPANLVLRQARKW